MGEPFRSALSTRDQDLAVEAFTGLIEHKPRIRIARPQDVDFRLASARFPDWGAHRIASAGVRYQAVVDPMPFLAAGMVTHGHGVIHAPGETVTLHAGDSFLYPLHASYTVDYLNCALPYLQLTHAYAADLAEEMTGLPARDLRFLSIVPVSAETNAFWAGTVRFLVDQLNDSTLEVSPLVADHMHRLATGALLHAFPNTAMTAARIPRPGSARPAVVRRAMAFMDANADRPLTVAEVAGAARVGPRALQAAFRRHLDITPLAYLRRVRLENAHRDLQAAHPTGDVMVSSVARRWGFSNMGRFTADYRKTFGELPGQTLRSTHS